jgi:radical SAM superfamily enzyme YgiQ (UPF0313 family)
MFSFPFLLIYLWENPKEIRMRVLLISPEYPDTYWSFRYALKFVSKKAANPPLGLLTIAAMLPVSWEKKVVDLNVSSLKDKDLNEADYVLISAMSVQAPSADQVIEKCKQRGKKIIAGGPMFTGNPDAYLHLDHLILNEAEITLPLFLADLERGEARQIYRSEAFAVISRTPAPDYTLIKASSYAQLSLQYSRGCPFDCEFCEITSLLGRKVRTKSPQQIMNELNQIYLTGFKGNIFFVDDNFIGNRHKLKKELLPAIRSWNEGHDSPFTFTTEASIDMADDPELMSAMVAAGFEKVFVGIETVETDSLAECDKKHNLDRDLSTSVKQIQSAGIEVTAGFIVGFDSDTPGVFQRQINFIQQTGILTAMVGLLNAPNKTRLYHRLKKEGRLQEGFDGNNCNDEMNFTPKMDKEKLLAGFRSIHQSIYSSKAYYQRLKGFLKHYQPGVKGSKRVNSEKIKALLRSVFYLGILNRGRIYYWKIFIWSLFNRPRLFPLAITYSIYGYHFRKVYEIR